VGVFNYLGHRRCSASDLRIEDTQGTQDHYRPFGRQTCQIEVLDLAKR
jgi:hypothetical protein